MEPQSQEHEHAGHGQPVEVSLAAGGSGHAGALERTRASCHAQRAHSAPVAAPVAGSRAVTRTTLPACTVVSGPSWISASSLATNTVPSGATVSLAQTITLPTVTFPTVTSASQSDASFSSVYIQDQIDIGDHVKLVGGIRYDHFRISSTNLVSGFAGQRSDSKGTEKKRAGHGGISFR